MKAWTDYPIVAFGDAIAKEAPVRECQVLSYDGNKYCKVQIGEHIEEIKACYIYQREGRCGQVPALSKRMKAMLIKGNP